MIIRPLGLSNSCNTSTSNNYGNANLVKLSHIALSNAAHTINCHYANGTLKFTAVLLGGESMILEKSPTDTINSTSSDTSVRIVPVAYKN
jgi:hypothetical protein